jgi:hypothetical protein
MQEKALYLNYQKYQFQNHPVIKPADIAPSTIIQSEKKLQDSEPPKAVIIPSEVAPLKNKYTTQHH